jgi:hypothetical protein
VKKREEMEFILTETLTYYNEIETKKTTKLQKRERVIITIIDFYYLNLKF